MNKVYFFYGKYFKSFCKLQLEVAIVTCCGVVCMYSVCTGDEGALRRFLIGIAAECPFGGNPEHCHAYELRGLTMKQRLEWIEKLSHEKKIEFYESHKQCYEVSKR